MINCKRDEAQLQGTPEEETATSPDAALVPSQRVCELVATQACSMQLSTTEQSHRPLEVSSSVS